MSRNVRHKMTNNLLTISNNKASVRVGVIFGYVRVNAAVLSFLEDRSLGDTL